jgi:hypothetical protein
MSDVPGCQEHLRPLWLWGAASVSLSCGPEVPLAVPPPDTPICGHQMAMRTWRQYHSPSTQTRNQLQEAEVEAKGRGRGWR